MLTNFISKYLNIDFNIVISCNHKKIFGIPMSFLGSSNFIVNTPIRNAIQLFMFIMLIFKNWAFITLIKTEIISYFWARA